MLVYLLATGSAACGQVAIDPVLIPEAEGTAATADAAADGDAGAVLSGDALDVDPDLCPDDPDKDDPGECGCGQPDVDSDGDMAADCFDECPQDALKTQPETCGCGIEDTDGDGDATPDCDDGCPADPFKTAPESCGCGAEETDSDADGSPDCVDTCPVDADKSAPGACGCGVADEDLDDNGELDCMQACPVGSLNMFPGQCGCDVAETDTDGDGSADCNDECDNDPAKAQPGQCGCGTPDTDRDGDGTAVCNDACDDDPTKTDPGLCGCGVPDTDGDSDGEPDCLEVWFDPGWTHREPLTLTSAMVSGSTQPFFPVLIQDTRTEWRRDTDGGHVGRANGGDIVFTGDDGVTPLDHEIESYDPSTGALTAWVEVPALSGNTDTTLFMYYGNPSASNQWSRRATWDEGGADHARGVWHLDETGMGARSDSSPNRNDCSTVNYDGNEASGGIAGGADLLGGDDWLSCTSDASLNVRNSLTMSGWVRLASRPSRDDWMNITWKHDAYGMYVFGTRDDTTHLAFDLYIDGSRHDVYDVGTIDLAPNQWHHVAVTFDGTNVRGYVNGQPDFTYSAPGTIDASVTGLLTLGEAEPDPGELPFDGHMDELRVASTARSQGWIRTSYENQSAPTSFVNVGAEEGSPF